MTWYHENGCVGCILVVHVDDVMLSYDGTKEVKALVDKFYNKFPFSEWEQVHKAPNGVAYTGRTIRVITAEKVAVNQRDFVEGRLAIPPCKKSNRADDDPCDATEKAEFRSATGNLHWVTSQTRFDQAVNTSLFQKRQNNPLWGRL